MVSKEKYAKHLFNLLSSPPSHTLTDRASYYDFSGFLSLPLCLVLQRRPFYDHGVRLHALPAVF